MKKRSNIFAMGIAILLLLALCTATLAETTTTEQQVEVTDSVPAADAAVVEEAADDVLKATATEKTPEQIAAEEEAINAYKEQLIALQKSALNIQVVYGRITQEKADEVLEAYKKALEERISAIQDMTANVKEAKQYASMPMGGKTMQRGNHRYMRMPSRNVYIQVTTNATPDTTDQDAQPTVTE